MDLSATALQRPSTSPGPLKPISSRFAASKEDGTLESRIQQLLESWMEHFDGRFQELARFQEHAALRPFHHSSYVSDQSEMFNEFESSKMCRDSAAAESSKICRDSAAAESHNIRFLDQEQDEEFSEQRLTDLVLQPEGEKKQSYKKVLERSSALKARQTVKERMMDLHQHLSHSKSGIVPRGLKRVLHHPQFETVISLAIIINGIIIGVQVEITARSGPGDHDVFAVSEGIFFVIFVAELVLRVYGLRSKWVKSLWNIFDAALVMTQLTEFVLEVSGANMASKGSATGRVLRIARLIRVVRVLRLLRFFSQLRVMVNMIMFSLDSLFWLMVLLVVMMYIVSVVFTQGVTDYAISDYVDLSRRASLEHNFGDLSSSSWTLFQAITNGISWGAVAEDLFEVHVIFFITFVLFMFFVFFSVLNVVTGVFVDGAIQHAGQEREVLISAERASMEGICAKLTELLVDMDMDGNGTISLDELIECGKDPNLASYFSALEIHTPETAELFAFLDKDEDGQIDVREFIDGCLRIRGGARNVDLHMLMFRMEGEMMMLKRKLEDTFDDVKKSIARVHNHISQVQTDIHTIPEHATGLRPSLTPRKLLGSLPRHDPQTPREVESNEEIPCDAHFGNSVPYSPRLHISKQHRSKQMQRR